MMGKKVVSQKEFKDLLMFKPSLTGYANNPPVDFSLYTVEESTLNARAMFQVIIPESGSNYVSSLNAGFPATFEASHPDYTLTDTPTMTLYGPEFQHRTKIAFSQGFSIVSVSKQLTYWTSYAPSVASTNLFVNPITLNANATALAVLERMQGKDDKSENKEK